MSIRPHWIGARAGRVRGWARNWKPEGIEPLSHGTMSRESRAPTAVAHVDSLG